MPVLRTSRAILARTVFLFALLAPGVAWSGEWVVITVSTLEDAQVNDGACSLREAIVNANLALAHWSDCPAGDPDHTIIRFHPDLAGQTIVLNGSQLPNITKSMTIEGPIPGNPDSLIIDGDEQSRLLRVNGADSVTIRDLTLTGGFVSDVLGGAALYLSNDAEVTLERTRITDNALNASNGRGGAVRVSGGTVTIVDSELASNEANGTGSRGGALSVNGQAILMQTTVAHNHAGQGGGGIFLEADASLTAINSTISRNRALAGGGGGIYLIAAEANLIYSTMAYNEATSGFRDLFAFAGTDQTAQVHLTNTVIFQFYASYVTCAFNGDVNTTVSNSLSTHANCTGQATSPASIDIPPLANNGGLTRTHALPAGSVAIGLVEDCTTEPPTGIDQRGQPRPGGLSTRCDAGAYESQLIIDEIFHSNFEMQPEQ